MSSLVKLVNVGDEDFVDTFAGAKYIIPAGVGELVPDGAMRLWLGDPQAQDQPRERMRKDEHDRLKVRFGANSGMQGDVRGFWDDVKPTLEAYTTSGERIWTVLDDPEGTHGGGGAPVYTNEELSRMLVEQIEANRALASRIEESNIIPRDPLDPATDELPPADKPNRVQVSAGKNRD